MTPDIRRLRGGRRPASVTLVAGADGLRRLAARVQPSDTVSIMAEAEEVSRAGPGRAGPGGVGPGGRLA